MKGYAVIAGGVLGVLSLAAMAWYDLPDDGGDVYIAITRVVTSETRALDFLPGLDGGYDYGDTTNAITEVYGGSPFEFGKPLQIEIYMTAPPTNDAWEVVELQYMTGTNSGASTNWTRIRRRDTGLDYITEVRGCHIGLQWVPPMATSYLVRVYGTTTGRVANANVWGLNIDADGNAGSWDDHEVVGFVVTENIRPVHVP